MKRSPDVLPYGWRCRYFFFFATFFAGTFLAAFLVAICLFSLSMTFIDSANLTADEECIDSRIASVKRKTTYRWKNRQQFFEYGIGIGRSGSENVARPEQSQRQANNKKCKLTSTNIRNFGTLDHC
jgi:hypothetical protein